MELTTLLAELIERKGSDLHLLAGEPPAFRIDGALTRQDGPALDAAEMEALLLPHLTDDQRVALTEQRQDVETILRHDGYGFRFNVFRGRDGLAAVLRAIPNRIPALEELDFEANVAAFLRSLLATPRGLVLFTGPTGSGKITSVFSLLETINRDRTARILTIEDPVGFEMVSRQSLVTQRYVGEDVPSFEAGLHSAFHEDPDVVLVGEMRSLETVHLSLALAESGHLVFSTLHLENVSDAVNRLVDVFPEPRDVIRRTLARNLVAVIAQRLLPRSPEPGRVVVNEVLTVTPRVRQMIAEGQKDLSVAIEAGREAGMQTMDDAVLKRFRAGKISYETAWANMQDRERLGPRPLGL